LVFLFKSSCPGTRASPHAALMALYSWATGPQCAANEPSSVGELLIHTKARIRIRTNRSE
jgi:hypothetical protein